MWLLPQCCTSPAHEEATLYLSLLPMPWLLPLQLPSPSLLPLPTLLPSPSPSPSPIAIAVGHCCCGCCQPSPPPSLFALLSAIAVTVACAIGHCHLCHHWPLQLPFPSAITITIAVGHFQELLPWHGKKYSNNLSKECLPYFILFGQWAVH